ncbi:Thimet oligopeptidase [Labilithrix luteola]|uniref:Thimet oligopeptidase n=1 Tax=Labilithrix luteola TaxID=1391654 RepID=A0A0K1QCN2_9BACT|nr:M3 family metallopeptidase [Labilithrix luteola]AKV03504.1 Thimet oligopeptidase [Labilithrix luteola]
MQGRLSRSALFFCLSSLSVLSVSCAGQAPAPSAPPVTTAQPASSSSATKGSAAVALAPLDVDPVVVGLGRSNAGPGTEADAGLARDGIVRLCDESLARATSLLDEIRALDGKPDSELTWASTVGKLDHAKIALRNAGDFPSLMAVSHPDETVRDRAKTCEPRIDKLETSLWLDPKLASVIKRYAARNEKLSGPQKRLMDRVVRDFRRNGLDLDPKGQARLRELNEQLTQLGQDFDSNLAASHLTIDATPAELEGLPKEWLAAHTPKANGKIEITTDYPDYFPVVTYAKNRKVALELYKQFDNRGADKNVALIEKILVLRNEKAKLLGYSTWADYVTEPRMAKSAQNVATFLEGLRKHLAKKGDQEIAEFRAMHVKLGGKPNDVLPPSDRLYLEDQVRKAKYGLDSKEVSQYFEVRNVKEGLLAITSKMFGLKYRPAPNLPTWHPDVEPMEVTDTNGKVLGRFYFDLYPREGKYKHAAVFSIRDTMKMDDGSRLMPIAAIECNFPKPGGAGPALMTHQDAVTFFHEFGHILHHVLSNAELSTFAGTSVARDFVESPSQMLEEWAWAKETLDLFAVHYETKKPMPAKLHAAMLRSRGFGRALATQRQLFLAALDQAYHTRPLVDGHSVDTTKVLAEINDSYTPFKYVEGTHFQATFGHLIGYDAGYYGYQWALSIAQDLFTRFKKEGMLNPKVAADYRAKILEPGASDDEAKLVENFLGRPGTDAAYKAFLLE